MNADTILKSVNAVTKKWTKQRKSEERGKSKASRRDAMTRSDRVTVKDAAFEVMEKAYLKASSGGKLPASARQIMYAARRHILKKTHRQSLDDQYFTQAILPQYVARYPKKTLTWDVTYDARGHFAEPHTNIIVPLGTLDVRRYLASVHEHEEVEEEISAECFHCQDEGRFPTAGPANRFRAMLFIEKEGFMPLFEAAKLAQRYDIAIMSTKGMPVVACRYLADTLCGKHGIPLLVLRDFDKAGFSIVGTLQDVDRYDANFNEIAKRYEYMHDIEVIDMGLRLADVERYALESEAVSYRSNPSGNLKQNGATSEEIEFLCERSWGQGQRVELNAFTSGDFIEWIESKLEHHGITKVVPDADTLQTAYRRAIHTELVHRQLSRINGLAAKQAAGFEPPKTMEWMIRKRLKEDPTISWDQALTEIAVRKCKERPYGNARSKQAKS